MRTLAIELPGIGEPESLRTITRELPDPGPGEAVVRVEATGVSFAEQQMRLGKYYDQPPFPFVPGYDLVGVVERVGAGVALAPGRRVAALTKTGAWAERVVLPAADLAPVPDGVDPVDAETAIVNGLTAWRMLHRTARVGRGGTIVVLGAAGGVGSLLVQLARNAGARVIAAAGGEGKLALARELGADEAVDYTREGWAASLEADVVFDGVGGAIASAAFGTLRPGGRMCSFGLASGTWAKIEPEAAHAREVELVSQARPTPEESSQRTRHALAEAAAGRLRPVIAQAVPLADAAAAHAAIEARATAGKTLLVA
jgi:NADPH:quinone reductase